MNPLARSRLETSKLDFVEHCRTWQLSPQGQKSFETILAALDALLNPQVTVTMGKTAEDIDDKYNHVAPPDLLYVGMIAELTKEDV